MSARRIDYAGSVHDEREIEAVVAVLRGGNDGRARRGLDRERVVGLGAVRRPHDERVRRVEGPARPITQGLALEHAGTGVRVDTIEPRTAVLSEGAAALVGATLREDQVEPMETMVEAVVALADCPPDLTGRTCVNPDLVAELGLTVRALDGKPLR